MDKIIKKLIGSLDKKKSPKKKVKLDLTIKKIKNSNTVLGNYKIKKNTFTTFIKKSNFSNSIPIYTKFPQNIDQVNEFYGYSAIKAMVTDKLGRLYIGGSFNKIGNLVCNNVAMWDGKKWSSLNNGLNSQVTCLGIDSENNLFVGGSFEGSGNSEQLGFIYSTNIIKWNGTKWIPLDAGVNSNVSTIGTLTNGKIVIGGSFDKSIGSETPLQKIAMWDGNKWVNLGADFLIHKSIYSLAVDSTNKIYIGGYNNLPASVLDYNTSVWTILKDSQNNIMDQVANSLVIEPTTLNPVFSGSIGDFGTVTQVHNVIQFDLATSTWIPLNNPDGYGLDNQCYTLKYDEINNKIIAGGSFSYLTNGGDKIIPLNRVATWDGKFWSPLGSGINGSNVESFAFLPDKSLCIGGNILGSNNLWSNALVVYTNDYVNIVYKNDILYTLTNLDRSITISTNCKDKYVFQELI